MGKLTMLVVHEIIVEQITEHVCICCISDNFSRKHFRCKICTTLCSGYSCSSQISRVDWVAAWMKIFSRLCFFLSHSPINVCIHDPVMRWEPLYCCRNPSQGKSQVKNIHKKKIFLTHQFASIAPKWGTNYLGFDGKREFSYLSRWL